MSNPRDRYFKGKRAKLVFWTGLIFIICFSFGAGYLLGKQNNPAPIMIEMMERDR